MRSAQALAQVDALPRLGAHAGAYLAVVRDHDAHLADRNNRAVAVVAYDDRRRRQLLAGMGNADSGCAERDLLAEAGAYLAAVADSGTRCRSAVDEYADRDTVALVDGDSDRRRRLRERRNDETHHGGGAHAEDNETTAHDQVPPEAAAAGCRAGGVF